MTITTKVAGAYAGIVGIKTKKTGVYTAIVGAFVKVAGAYQRVDAAVTPTLISASSRQGAPSSYGGLGVNSNYTGRQFDFAQQAVDDLSGAYFNWTSNPNIIDGQQEQPCQCFVDVTAAILTNVVGTGLNQSAATLAQFDWTKAAAGVEKYLMKLSGNAIVTPTSAQFTADGGAILNGGKTIRCPPGYGVRTDEMTSVKGLRGAYCRQVQFSAAPPVTVTVAAGTYLAGTPIPFSGQTAAPANGWRYVTTGTGVIVATNTVAGASGTVASFDNSGVLTLSRDFTSTGGTITLQSVFAAGTGDIKNGIAGDASKLAATPNTAVGVKDWTTIGFVDQTTGGVAYDLHWIVGTSQAGLGCMLINETSISNGNHDQVPDGHWGDALSSKGFARRACTLNKLPSVSTAVSGSSMIHEVPSAAFPNAAPGPMKMYMASICTDIVPTGPYNTRGLSWLGVAGTGLQATQRAYNLIYKNACRMGLATKVYACTLLPGCSGTFANAAGQIAAANTIDPAGGQMQYRAWLMGSGRVPANGDPDVGIDISLPLHNLAAANGLTMPGTDAQNSIDIGKWPHSADWVSNSYRGSTLEGVHENYIVATYLAPVVAAQLPVYS